MCKNNGETVNHLLHCAIARDLWSFVFSLFGVLKVIPYIMLDLLICWKGLVIPYIMVNLLAFFLLVISDILIGSPWIEPVFPHRRAGAAC
jgi:hypothetical protein